MTTENACAWFEIPAGDPERARAFHGAVLKRDLDVSEGGPSPMAAFTDMSVSGVSGRLCLGRPAASGTGPTIWPALTEWSRVDAGAALVVVPWRGWPAERSDLGQPAGRRGPG